LLCRTWIIASITTSAAVPCTGVLIAARWLCARSAFVPLFFPIPGSRRIRPVSVLT
jgi:hypothetical protein